MSQRLIVCAAVLAVLAALLSGCASPLDRGPRPLPGEKTVGDLRVGPYNYVAACDVFTAADYTSLFGPQPLQMPVRATLATRTYQVQDPYRVYRSECQRANVTVAIDQHPTAEQLQRGARFLPGAPDNALAKALGVDRERAFSDPHDSMFAAVLDNKILKATVNAQLGVRLMELLQRRLRALANHPTAALDVTRPGGKVGGLPYVSACRLLLPADFTQALGLAADEGAIEAEFPPSDIPPTTHYVKQENSCRIGSMPDKTSREASMEAAQRALNQVTTHAEVTVSQTLSPGDAAQLLAVDGAQPVRGLGDQAVYVSRTNAVGDAVQFLRVRRGTYVVEFRVSHDGMGASTAEGMDTLRKLAAAAVSRMT